MLFYENVSRVFLCCDCCDLPKFGQSDYKSSSTGGGDQMHLSEEIKHEITDSSLSHARKI
jgi:hypothetical protein